MSLLETEILHIPFRLSSEIATIRQFLSRYQSVPMSLADACLVRMAEMYLDYSVLTLDSDFAIYRKNRDRLIPTITPASS